MMFSYAPNVGLQQLTNSLEIGIHSLLVLVIEVHCIDSSCYLLSHDSIYDVNVQYLTEAADNFILKANESAHYWADSSGLSLDIHYLFAIFHCTAYFFIAIADS